MNKTLSIIQIIVLAGIAFLLSACSSTHKVTQIPLADPHDLLMFNGRDGTALTWEEVLSQFDNYDVVVIGELHGHPNGLNTAATLWKEALVNNPEAALSMEFFERDQQLAMNDYLSGVTDEEQFLKAARRSGGNYPDGHKSMIEEAKANGRPVYAANSPRRYNTLARTEGYDRLRELSFEQQRLFVIPDTLPEGRYKDDFFEIMRGMFDMNLHGETEGAAAESKEGDSKTDDKDQVGNDDDDDDDNNKKMDDDDDDDDTDENNVNGDDDDNDVDEVGDTDDQDAEKPELTEEQIKTLMDIYRSQCMWDSTMADSILEGVSAGYRPVVHVVGQFHVNYGGGIPNRLKLMRPSLKVYTISVINEWSDQLREDDKDKADCVIYVGPSPDDMMAM